MGAVVNVYRKHTPNKHFAQPILLEGHVLVRVGHVEHRHRLGLLIKFTCRWAPVRAQTICPGHPRGPQGSRSTPHDKTPGPVPHPKAGPGHGAVLGNPDPERVW